MDVIARQHIQLIFRDLRQSTVNTFQEEQQNDTTRIFVRSNPPPSPPFSLPAYQELPWLL